MVERACVVKAARNWLGTRFHHQGRLKRNSCHQGGVDCLGLLMGIARELDIKQPNGLPIVALDKIDYSHYPDVDFLREMLNTVLTNIPVASISSGNILLLSIDNHPQHLAVVSDHPTGLGIIHAYAPARAVVEHALNEWWMERIISAYTF